MTIPEYLQKIDQYYLGGKGDTTEHTYRGFLQTMLENILTEYKITNEFGRIACGAPDYIVAKKDIPVGYIEAKDLNVDILSKNHDEQFDRYRQALDNLIITNYLDFHFYRNGELVEKIFLAKIVEGKIIAEESNSEAFIALIKSFGAQISQTIKSAPKLATMMADKAKLLSMVIERALLSDETTQADSSIREQFEAFKQVLIHDLSIREFADIYAQTIAYGMFAARLHDATLDTFTRQEAAELIPKSNPFLRKLFGYIAGPEIDNRIVWIVDALADIFRATDVEAILKNFGHTTAQHDPVIHFYETFLAEYDPKLRKSRGVWYTPEPVVQFIVRAVDDILTSEFNLSQGLADTAKTAITVETQTPDKRTASGRKSVEKTVHKVQILDPATGTATFLAEAVRLIHARFAGQAGLWSSYVEEHLLPRLNGFEILMAPYAMAHLKLRLLLDETGYQPKQEQRLRIFLTNSLEEYHPDTSTLFASFLSTESNEANHIKRDTPVMVVMGNPPYSGESANKGEWITKLMEEYKTEPGGKTKLKERNSKWLNDDYVKFLRYGQYFIEKNGEGILAFINPHGYLDNPTFRGMRWQLLKTYDQIYTIDLHGNSKKKEVAPDGSKDENVFDIMQGVSINIFIKTGRKKNIELAQLFHYDLFGKRETKYGFLESQALANIPFAKLENVAPNYFFVPKDFSLQKEYDRGFALNELFPLNTVGIVTAKDAVLINESKDALLKNVAKHYGIEPDENLVKPIAYRPFDNRLVYYDTKLIERGREKVMQHFLASENYGLIFKRGGIEDLASPVFVTKNITEFRSWSRPGMQGGDFICPLYLYPQKTKQASSAQSLERTPNLNSAIVEQLARGLNLRFVTESSVEVDVFASIDVLDYCYAILHSPRYRAKFQAFLKIDFPRVPYPKSVEQFWQLVALGRELRNLHLLASPAAGELLTTYPITGSNRVDKVRYEAGKVWLNTEQYFDQVPASAWQFYVGGYQPAQKWLKDRVGKVLTFDDIIHYQKIIAVLTKSVDLMEKIDGITHPVR
ncbi:MAG: type ISP restriction/modification enzyme [Candidatus Falkowbacteria bacterium]